MPSLKIVLTDEESEQMKSNARAVDMSQSAYIKNVALGGGVVLKKNYETIEKHSHKIDEVLNEMRQTIAIIRETNQAFNPDLERILQCMIEISQTENELLQTVRKERAKDTKTFKEAVQKAVIKKLGEVSDND